MGTWYGQAVGTLGDWCSIRSYGQYLEVILKKFEVSIGVFSAIDGTTVRTNVKLKPETPTS